MIPLKETDYRLFRVFFDTMLAPRLSALTEYSNGEIENPERVRLGFLVAGVFFLFLISWRTGFAGLAIICLLAAALVHSLYCAGDQWDAAAVAKFQTEIIAPIARFTDARLRYSPDDTISDFQLDQSQLFHNWRCTYGVHHFRDPDDDCELEFSFVAIDRNYFYPTDFVLNPNFLGMVLVRNLPHPLRGTTVVFPNTFRERFNWFIKKRLGSPIQSELFPYDTGDDAFAALYRVLTTNPGEASRILAPDRLRYLIDLADRRRLFLSFSWTGEKGFVAVPIPDTLFVPPRKRRNLDFFRCEQIFATINLCLDLGKRLPPGADLEQ